MLYKVVLTLKSVDQTLVCDHSKKAIEQYFQMMLFTMLYKVVLTFKFVELTFSRLSFNDFDNLEKEFNQPL